MSSITCKTWEWAVPFVKWDCKEKIKSNWWYEDQFYTIPILVLPRSRLAGSGPLPPKALCTPCLLPRLLWCCSATCPRFPITYEVTHAPAAQKCNSRSFALWGTPPPWLIGDQSQWINAVAYIPLGGQLRVTCQKAPQKMPGDGAPVCRKSHYHGNTILHRLLLLPCFSTLGPLLLFLIYMPCQQANYLPRRCCLSLCFQENPGHDTTGVSSSKIAHLDQL